MTPRRFTLPRLRKTRNPGRHTDNSSIRSGRALPARRVRPGIAAAMAILTLTAGTAAAVAPMDVGAAETSAETSAVGSTVTPDPTDDPTITIAGDSPATVEATSAVQRAEQVTTEAPAVSKKQQKKIDKQADEVTELLLARDSSAASRSSERPAIPTSVPDDSASDAATDEAEESPADLTGNTPDTGETADAVEAVEAVEAVDADLVEATSDLTEMLADAEEPVPVEAAPATPAEILAAEAEAASSAAAELAKKADSLAGYENGQIPSDEMCELSFASGETLRCDAAAQLERLDDAYHAKFGKHLSVTDSYRSYDSQVATKASKGYLAAAPGYSDHGWGVAVDLGEGVESFGSAQYDWLRENAPEFGWDNPGWARSDGRKPEAWHWEYTPLD